MATEQAALESTVRHTRLGLHALLSVVNLLRADLDTVCKADADTEYLIVFHHDLKALRRAFAVVSAAAEWREAEADEWNSPAAESRKTAAICDLIDAIDAIQPDDAERFARMSKEP